MKYFARNSFFAVALAAAAASIACEVPSSNTTTTNANTTASPQPNATPAAASVDVERLARQSSLTLPMLDAMFANDEAFAGELKSQVNLTDEQVAQLKTTAREQTSSLREAYSEDNYSGTTAQARERALEKIRGIVGEEKTAQFVGFINSRVNNGGDMTNTNNASDANAAGMNNVPTDTRIVVNAPAYRMDLFENGKLVKSYKVGIGYPEFPLPQGQRKADTIIYNPTWTPPDEPWVEASDKVQAGVKVDAGNPLNPLGPIKIPIGLPSLIHGGKQVAKLGTFASHGCVGLTNNQIETFARDLAKLTGTELTDEQITEYQKDKTVTKNVKLDNPIPVELRYNTIVVEDGKLRIYRDVYDRDTNTEENLRRVLDAYGVSFDSLTAQEQTRIREALKQMSRDAKGNLDTSNNNSNANGNSNANANSANNNKNAKNSNVNSSTITRTVKGAKEVTIELAALKGKGYPAAVALDSGSGAAKSATTTSKKRRG